MEEENQISCEPMDVDLSSHSLSAMDISYIEQSFEKTPVVNENDGGIIKELCVNNLIKNQNFNQRQTKSRKSFILFNAIVLLAAILIYQITQFRCNEYLNMDQLKETLLSKLHGQASAVETLVKALEDEVSSKIIILYGSTGVGKTYTASLILDNLLEYSNTYHYTMPSFVQTSLDFMFGILFCKSSIVVVDDLMRSDIIMIKNRIHDLVRKSEELSKKLTIFLLFNCKSMNGQSFQECDEVFVQELRQSLANVKSTKYFVKYESLSDKHLKLCIENELPTKKLSETDFKKICKNFNVKLDGCKGVYQKMKYLNII